MPILRASASAGYNCQRLPKEIPAHEVGGSPKQNQKPRASWPGASGFGKCSAHYGEGRQNARRMTASWSSCTALISSRINHKTGRLLMENHVQQMTPCHFQPIGVR